MRIKWNFLILSLSSGLFFKNGYAQSDTTIFTYQEYIENITKYHPIVKKADLKLKFGEAEIVKAKGNFDPTILSDWSEKNFDGKQYYRIYQTKLRIPTPIGLDIVGGYEKTNGVFLNPENATGQNGLWHLGIELDILQGFLVNERRNTLEQSKVFQELVNNERQILLNDIIYDGSTAYFQWQLYHHFKIVLTENQELGKRYVDNTKQSYLGGEKTAMDTLEAFILYQDAILMAQKNEMELIKSRLVVENYLWYEDAPVSLQQRTIPEDYQKSYFINAGKWTDTIAVTNNPILLASLYKLSMLELEQKLKREKLKPKLKVKYNPLLKTTPSSIAPIYSFENYTWGFVFSMPLLFRNERANIQQGEVKISEIELDIQNKRNELQNKIESTWRQLPILQDQIDLSINNANNYKQLLDGEFDKFRFGESSVFLLNKRQEKYITSQLKLIDMKIKQQTEKLKFLYLTNQLLNN
ncbi:MAG: TolC family protein [Saprospiraceae bacterium]